MPNHILHEKTLGGERGGGEGGEGGLIDKNISRVFQGMTRPLKAKQKKGWVVRAVITGHSQSGRDVETSISSTDTDKTQGPDCPLTES